MKMILDFIGFPGDVIFFLFYNSNKIGEIILVLCFFLFPVFSISNLLKKRWISSITLIIFSIGVVKSVLNYYILKTLTLDINNLPLAYIFADRIVIIFYWVIAISLIGLLFVKERVSSINIINDEERERCTGSDGFSASEGRAFLAAERIKEIRRNLWETKNHWFFSGFYFVSNSLSLFLSSTIS